MNDGSCELVRLFFRHRLKSQELPHCDCHTQDDEDSSHKPNRGKDEERKDKSHQTGEQQKEAPLDESVQDSECPFVIGHLSNRLPKL
jgi:hypothetical protein